MDNNKPAKNFNKITEHKQQIFIQNKQDLIKTQTDLIQIAEGHPLVIRNIQLDIFSELNKINKQIFEKATIIFDIRKLIKDEKKISDEIKCMNLIFNSYGITIQLLTLQLIGYIELFEDSHLALICQGLERLSNLKQLKILFGSNELSKLQRSGQFNKHKKQNQMLSKIYNQKFSGFSLKNLEKLLQGLQLYQKLEIFELDLFQFQFKQVYLIKDVFTSLSKFQSLRNLSITFYNLLNFNCDADIPKIAEGLSEILKKNSKLQTLKLNFSYIRQINEKGFSHFGKCFKGFGQLQTQLENLEFQILDNYNFGPAEQYSLNSIIQEFSFLTNLKSIALVLTGIYRFQALNKQYEEFLSYINCIMLNNELESIQLFIDVQFQNPNKQLNYDWVKFLLSPISKKTTLREFVLSFRQPLIHNLFLEKLFVNLFPIQEMKNLSMISIQSYDNNQTPSNIPLVIQNLLYEFINKLMFKPNSFKFSIDLTSITIQDQQSNNRFIKQKQLYQQLKCNFTNQMILKYKALSQKYKKIWRKEIINEIFLETTQIQQLENNTSNTQLTNNMIYEFL